MKVLVINTFGKAKIPAKIKILWLIKNNDNLTKDNMIKGAGRVTLRAISALSLRRQHYVVDRFVFLAMASPSSSSFLIDWIKLKGTIDYIKSMEGVGDCNKKPTTIGSQRGIC